MATHASSAPKLLLTEHAFVCLTDNTLVFLNLHKDKYSCLESKHTKAIAQLLGLPIIKETEAEITKVSEDIVKVVQDLIDSGIATRDATNGKRAEFIPQNSELKEILGYFPGDGPRVNISHVLNFLNAMIIANFSRRFLPIEFNINRIKRRKQRHYDRGGIEPEKNKVIEIVEVYKILKPLFTKVKDECLFNSMFLLEFLSHYKIYPSWYFGVRLNEFYAHCWVQHKNILYDDFACNTMPNEPIMVI